METEHSKPQIVHFDITSGKIENQKSFNGAPYIIFQKHTNESVSPHWHPQSEFWLIQEGIGKVTLDSTTYNVQAGDIVYINSKVKHSMDKKDARGLSYLCLIVENYFMEECGVSDATLFEEVIRDNEITRLINDIYLEALHKPDSFELKIKADLIGIAVLLTRDHFMLQSGERKAIPETSGEATARNIIDYIQSNYQSKLSLSKIAKSCHLSKCYMCRVFKEATGDTILSYINNIRCIYAEYLICTTNMSVADAAEASGFSSAAYFSRVFKKIYGYPPIHAKSRSKAF
ncbi:MAG: AraC family transcriptional regulator [Clostridia bacterium]|nr:AraC family transcriptional regulator [Clostridia bacterium]